MIAHTLLALLLLAPAGDAQTLHIASAYRFRADLVCHADPCVEISGAGFSIEGGHHAIDCNGVNQCVVLRAATGVMLMNLVVRNSGAYGVVVEGGRDVTLAGLTAIDHPVAAIALGHGSSGDALTRVTVRRSGTGIELREVAQVAVTNATATDNVWGVAIDASEAVSVEGSTIDENRLDGIVLRESAHATRVQRNRLHWNGNGIDVLGRDNLVSSNSTTWSTGFGIVVSGEHNLVSDNTTGENASVDLVDLGPGCARWEDNRFDSRASACKR